MPRIWRHRAGRAGLLLLLLIALGALLLPFVLPDPRVQPEGPALLPPGPGHWLGTDHLNRDVLARLVSGARVSLLVAGGAVLLSVTLGTLVGLVAGYLGGWVDATLMRLVDAALAIPRIFLLLLVVAIMDHIPLGLLILLIGVTGWFGTSRLVRAEVLQLRARDFVAGAEALGASRRRVMFRHLLPNAIGPLAAATTMAVGDVILLEAGLSFLGLGVQPPRASWGGMIFDAESYIVTAPWTSLAPGIMIVLSVLAVQLVGEALHEEEAHR